MKTSHLIALSAVALAVLAGCSSVPKGNAQLEQARTEYRAVMADPRAQSNAGTDMKLASDAMNKANTAWSSEEDEARVNHLAYLASQRVAIVRETMNMKTAEGMVASAGADRTQVQLQARTQEADAAQRSATVAQQAAANAQQNAAAAQRSTDMARSESAQAQQQTQLAMERNRQLETRCQAALALQQAAVRERVVRLCVIDGLPLTSEEASALSVSVVVLLTYWLSYEYVRDPRRALEPDNADAAVRHGTRQVMALLWPYLSAELRRQLRPGGPAIRPSETPSSLPATG